MSRRRTSCPRTLVGMVQPLPQPPNLTPDQEQARAELAVLLLEALRLYRAAQATATDDSAADNVSSGSR